MRFVLHSKRVSNHRKLPVSSEFPNRMYGRHFQGAMHRRELLSVINTSKKNPLLRPSMSCNEQGVELRPWSLSGQSFIALLAAVTLATIVGLCFGTMQTSLLIRAQSRMPISQSSSARILTMHWAMVTFLICAILHAQSPFPYTSPDACLCK
jgi:hypothetical protein